MAISLSSTPDRLTNLIKAIITNRFVNVLAMWIKKDKTIINTDNICAMRQEGDKLIFRLHGSTNPSTIDRAALSAEIVLKNIPSYALEMIWQGIQNGEKCLILE